MRRRTLERWYAEGFNDGLTKPYARIGTLKMTDPKWYAIAYDAGFQAGRNRLRAQASIIRRLAPEDRP